MKSIVFLIVVAICLSLTGCATQSAVNQLNRAESTNQINFKLLADAYNIQGKALKNFRATPRRP